MMGMPTAPAIPPQALETLKRFNPDAAVFYILADARFGVSLSPDLIQWVRYQASEGFVEAGPSTTDLGSQRVVFPHAVS
jgi:hypothetical protein